MGVQRERQTKKITVVHLMILFSRCNQCVLSTLCNRLKE